MAQNIGKFVVVILALVVAAAVINFLLGVIGIVFALIPLLIKLALIGAIFYFGWMVIRKLTRSSES